MILKQKSKPTDGNNSKQHHFYEENKDGILADLNKVGPRLARRKWNIPSSTFTYLVTRWTGKTPTAHASQPTKIKVKNETPKPVPVAVKQEPIVIKAQIAIAPVNKFWMVLIDDTPSTSYKHPSLESARKEAERLLRNINYIDRGVTILESVEYGKITYPPVNWLPVLGCIFQGAEIPEDVPF